MSFNFIGLRLCALRRRTAAIAAVRSGRLSWRAGGCAERHHATPSTVRPKTSPTTPAAAEWWKALNDPELNRLIEPALANSPDIHAAQARLRQSRAGLREQQRDELPKSSGSAAYLTRICRARRRTRVVGL